MTLALYPHQQHAIDLMRNKSMLLAAEPGVGKTAVGLKLAEHFKANPIRSGRTLVVAPLSLLEGAWAADCAKFTPGLKFRNLWAPTPLKRKKLLADTSGDIFCVNAEGFKRITNWCQAQRFDVLIVDESSCLINPRAQITKLMCQFAPTIPRVYPLSGTPTPNSPLDIWAQIYICDQNILGSSYWAFRSLYAYQTGYMGYDWRVTPEARAQLMQAITPRAIFLSKEECLPNLPSQTFMVRHVYMDQDQRQAYDRMLRDKILPLIGDRVATAPNILAELQKLRQICSGWLYDANHQTYNFSDSKARILDEVLNELGDRQVTIWAEYRHDISEIQKRLGNKATHAMGGMNPDDVQAALNTFKGGEKQYLIANPQTLGYGHTLTNCCYTIFYGLSYSWQRYKQACDRFHRISQTNPVFYIHLLCKKSIDEAIYRALQTKEDMARAAMSYLRENAD